MAANRPSIASIASRSIAGQSLIANRSTSLWALLLLVPAPTLGVIAAMALPWTRGTLVGQAIYGLSKAWILILPLIWTVWVERAPLSVSRPWKSRGLAFGAILGVTIAMVIVATYLLLGRSLIDVQQLRHAVAANGIGDPRRFLLFITGLTLINSLLEEYVWRWFVFRQCERLCSGRGALAVVLSATMFALHHFVALIAQTTPMVAMIGTAGVFIGGSAWSWCYLRFRSIWPGWISHIIVDAAVFGVGWLAIFG